MTMNHLTTPSELVANALRQRNALAIHVYYTWNRLFGNDPINGARHASADWRTWLENNHPGGWAAWQHQRGGPTHEVGSRIHLEWKSTEQERLFAGTILDGFESNFFAAHYFVGLPFGRYAAWYSIFNRALRAQVPVRHPGWKMWEEIADDKVEVAYYVPAYWTAAHVALYKPPAFTPGSTPPLEPDLERLEPPRDEEEPPPPPPGDDELEPPLDPDPDPEPFPLPPVDTDVHELTAQRFVAAAKNGPLLELHQGTGMADQTSTYVHLGNGGAGLLYGFVAPLSRIYHGALRIPSWIWQTITFWSSEEEEELPASTSFESCVRACQAQPERLTMRPIPDDYRPGTHWLVDDAGNLVNYADDATFYFRSSDLDVGWKLTRADNLP